MKLSDEQKGLLRSILGSPEIKDALDAACKLECARLERNAISALNERKLPEAERFAAFAGAYRSVISRLLSMADAEEHNNE